MTHGVWAAVEVPVTVARAEAASLGIEMVAPTEAQYCIIVKSAYVEDDRKRGSQTWVPNWMPIWTSAGEQDLVKHAETEVMKMGDAQMQFASCEAHEVPVVLVITQVKTLSYIPCRCQHCSVRR